MYSVSTFACTVVDNMACRLTIRASSTKDKKAFWYCGGSGVILHWNILVLVKFGDFGGAKNVFI